MARWPKLARVMGANTHHGDRGEASYLGTGIKPTARFECSESGVTCAFGGKSRGKLTYRILSAVVNYNCRRRRLEHTGLLPQPCSLVCNATQFGV